MKLVKVKWFDITNENNWVDIDDLDKDVDGELASNCYSVGWLYKKEPEYIVILTSKIIDKNGKLDRASYEIIPTGVIRETIVL